jgi:hypothetical protein
MSDANRVQLAYVEESTFAAKETGSNLQILRYKGETLKQDTGTTVSEEIRSDRQISDIARIGVSASGGIDFELSYGSHEELIKAALQSSGWSAEVKISASWTISAVAADNSINDSASEFGSFVANQWVYVSGFSTAANNGFKKILAVTAAKITFQTGTIVDESAGSAGITVQMGAQITNGTTLTTFNIEKDFQDLSNILGVMKGMAVNQLALDIPADNIITGSFDFMGSAEEGLTASSGSGYNAATTSNVMTGANHVTNFFENLTELPILSLALNLNNNLRTRLQVGNLGVASIGSGSVEITGTVTLYMSDASLYDKYLALNTTSIVFAAQDTKGNGYVIELPSVKIIDGTRNATGINTDIVGTFEFRAFLDASELISIRIARFPVMNNFYGLVSATSSVTGALTVT